MRDFASDKNELGRVYFPSIKAGQFTDTAKNEIITDIQNDFDEALIGIKLLPNACKLGVFTAYNYYLKLFEKIKNSSPQQIQTQRIRVSNPLKLLLVFKTYFYTKMKLI